MKKCPKCQEEIDDKAIKCKHCGSDLRNWFLKHKVITGFLVFVFIIVPLINSVSNNVKTKAEDSKTTTTNNATTNSTENKESNVPMEYKSALTQAESYSKIMRMSKQGVYDQLVSEYGGKFTTAAAQYAIDNLKADWNANALAKAKDYQKTMSLSPAAIHDQLTSANGEKFTQAEADYALAHLND